MIVPNSFNGDMMGDLSDQNRASEDRRTIAASPADFIRWVSQTLRDQKAVYENLKTEHGKLVRASDIATVGLKRLSSLVRFKNTVEFEHLEDLHRDFTFKTKNIGYTLERCKQVLNETTINMQFVGETLNSALADRHKKKAVQKELGLRLRDTDADFGRCQKAVDAQKKINRQLSEGIQNLMNKASIKLPPKLRQDMHREDAVSRIAVKHKKNLEKGKDVINSKAYVPGTRDKVRTLSGLGEDEQNPVVIPAGSAETTETPEAPEAPKKGLDLRIAIASITIGLIFGSLFFFREHL
jgi:hypothetical protein